MSTSCGCVPSSWMRTMCGPADQERDTWLAKSASMMSRSAFGLVTRRTWTTRAGREERGQTSARGCSRLLIHPSRSVPERPPAPIARRVRRPDRRRPQRSRTRISSAHASRRWRQGECVRRPAAPSRWPTRTRRAREPPRRRNHAATDRRPRAREDSRETQRQLTGYKKLSKSLGRRISCQLLVSLRLLDERQQLGRGVRHET
jgi:hypothetical protein